jgi:hypothetical protein
VNVLRLIRGHPFPESSFPEHTESPSTGIISRQLSMVSGADAFLPRER